jgi:hypothetical protein
MAKKTKPQIILDPDLAEDDDGPSSPIPDDDGWVYLQRKAKSQEEQRGKEPARKKRPR